MLHYHNKTKNDHRVNQWIIICSLYALDYAAGNITDDTDIRQATKLRFNNMKQWAQNTLTTSFRIKPNDKTDTDYIVYDHVVIMQKLFVLACSIPNEDLPEFLTEVNNISEKIIEKYSDNNVIIDK